MKVLITGGAGYLGSVLTKKLLERGEKVTCLDNLKFRQSSPLLFADQKDYAFVYGDARDDSLLKDLVPSHDAIIPLAAIVGMPACNLNPQDAVSTNLEAIISLNKLRSKDQMLIFPTTNSGYGTKSGELYCTEETPLEPISLYGKTKSDAERAILESGKDAITLRLATVFGVSPRMRTDLLVNDFTRKAVEDGYLVIFEKGFKRNFIHIKDIAECFEHCIDNFHLMKNTMYNVGLDSANISKAELADKIKEQVPKLEVIYHEFGEDPDKRNYIVSNAKLARAGFSAKHSLEEGISELVKYYQIMLKNNSLRNA